jgi:hypothetical protein
MHVPNEVYYVSFKAQSVTFKVLPFTIHTLVPTVLPKSQVAKSGEYGR